LVDGSRGSGSRSGSRSGSVSLAGGGGEILSTRVNMFGLIFHPTLFLIPIRDNIGIPPFLFNVVDTAVIVNQILFLYSRSMFFQLFTW